MHTHPRILSQAGWDDPGVVTIREGGVYEFGGERLTGTGSGADPRLNGSLAQISGLAVDRLGNVYFGEMHRGSGGSLVTRVSLKRVNVDGDTEDLGVVVDTSGGYTSGWWSFDIATTPDGRVLFTHPRVTNRAGTDTIREGGVYEFGGNRLTSDGNGSDYWVEGSFASVTGLAVDGFGNVYFGEMHGTQQAGSTKVSLKRVSVLGETEDLGVVVDRSGVIWSGDWRFDIAIGPGNRVLHTHPRIQNAERTVTLKEGGIYELGGNRLTGKGNGADPWVNGSLAGITGLAVDWLGNVYFGEHHGIIRKVSLKRVNLQGETEDLGVVVDTTVGFYSTNWNFDLALGPPPLFGEVSEILSGQVSRKTSEMLVPLKVGDKLRERDRIVTGDDAAVRIVLSDNLGSMTVGPNSEIFLAAWTHPQGDLISASIRILRGKISRLVLNAQEFRLFSIRSKGTNTRVTGTTLSIEVKTVGESEETTLTVTEGEVVFTDNETGEEESVFAGESKVLSHPLDHGNSRDEASDIAVNRRIEADLSSDADVDFFRFVTDSAGLIAVQSFGSEKTEGRLLDAQGNLIAESSRSFTNEEDFLILTELPAGSYFIEVRGQAGEYELRAASDTGYVYHIGRSGLTGSDTLFEADPEGRGLSNGMYYAFGVSGAGVLSPEERDRLPGAFVNGVGSGLRFWLPENLPPDLSFRIQGASSSSGGSLNWDDLALKFPEKDWEVLAPHDLTSGDPENGYVPVSFTPSLGRERSMLIRLAVELSDASVLYEPKLIEQLTNPNGLQIAVEPLGIGGGVGATGQIEVEAESKGEIIYQWFRDGEPLAGENQSVLRFSDLSEDDVGGYFVRLTSAGLSIDSETVLVRLYSDIDLEGGFVAVPAGTFLMGSPETELGRSADETLHEVSISKPFYISASEVVLEDFIEVMQWAIERGDVTVRRFEVGPGLPDAWELLHGQNILFASGVVSFVEETLKIADGKGGIPVDGVTWFGAVAYAHFLSEMEGVVSCYDLSDWSCDFGKPGYRLPTEAEWEYACRGGTDTAYYTGDLIDLNEGEGDVLIFRSDALERAGWYGQSEEQGIQVPKQKRANALGLYDMHGNVAEWCWDIETPYTENAVSDPRGRELRLEDGGLEFVRRAYRGGSHVSSPNSARSASRRFRDNPNTGNGLVSSNIGIRLVASSVQSDLRVPNFAPLATLGGDVEVLDDDDNGAEQVLLDGSLSVDVEGEIQEWLWSWDGGSAGGETATADFPVGESVVTLTVTDSDGESAQAQMLVRVLGIPQAPDYLRPVPGGSFTMGSPESELGRDANAEEQREVTIEDGFFMSPFEVTAKEFAELMQWALDEGLIEVMGSEIHVGGKRITPSDSDFDRRNVLISSDSIVARDGSEMEPVISINWYGAFSYAHFLALKELGYSCYRLEDWSWDKSKPGYRLPTEEEWEYACRAGTTTSFYTGEISTIEHAGFDPNLDKAGWYSGNNDSLQRVVGQKEANVFGLFDMHGNVSELCWDRTWGFSNNAVIRGGWWGAAPAECRSASRKGQDAASVSERVGFRVLLDTGSASGLDLSTIPPSANAGLDGESIDFDYSDDERFVLDGSRSTSIGGSIVSWEWTWEGGSASGETVEVALSVGEHLVTLTVEDSFGNRASDEVAFKVGLGPLSEAPDGFVEVPAGTFTMGSPESELGRSSNEAQEEVTIESPFYIATKELTNAELADVYIWAVEEGLVTVRIQSDFFSESIILSAGGEDLVNSGSLEFESGALALKEGVGDQPALGVGWYGAIAYAHFRSLKEGQVSVYDLSDWSCDFSKPGYRLPTSAEWEYACRAGSSTAFYTGPISTVEYRALDPNLDQAGWYSGNGDFRVQLGGLKQANAWGLFDMHGNLAEWCWDSPMSFGSVNERDAIVRGGWWGDYPANCRSAASSSKDKELESHSTPSDREGVRIIYATVNPGG